MVLSVWIWKKIDILEQTLAVILGMYVQLLYRIA